MDMNMNINKGFWLVLLTAFISGLSIFLNSFAVKGFDSSVFTFSKNIVVAILLFSLILFMKEFDSLKKLTKKQWLNLTIIGLVGGSIPFLLFFKGLQLAGGATSSFIHKTMFIFGSILAVIFLKEKLDKKTLSAVTLLLFGTYLMIRPDFNFQIAHLLILGAVLLWSVENILAKKILSEISGNLVAWGRMFFGSIFILLFLIFTGKAGTIFSMSQSQYYWIGLTSVLLFFYVMTYYNGLKHLSVTSSLAILSIGAPITSVLTWIYGTGSMSLFEITGAIAIVLGVIILAWKSSEVDVNKSTTHHMRS